MIDYVAELEKRVDVDDTAGPEDVLIHCPFHGDDNPSLEVHRTKGVFYCFGCEETGNFAKLLAELDGVSYHEAKRMLLEIETPERVLAEMEQFLLSEEEDEEPVPYFSNESFMKVYPSVFKHKEALKYLRKRGISDDTADWFDLRFGIEGLKWKNRIIIPIYTLDGKLMNYSGRTIGDVKPKIRKARPSRNTLFGCHLFEGPRKPVIIVEGEFDAMYLMQRGYWALAVTGTVELTDLQILILRKLASQVIIAYDNDIEKVRESGQRVNAGQKAQAKALKKLKGFLPVFGVTLPLGRDVDECSDEELKKLFGRYVR